MAFFKCILLFALVGGIASGPVSLQNGVSENDKNAIGGDTLERIIDRYMIDGAGNEVSKLARDETGGENQGDDEDPAITEESTTEDDSAGTTEDDSTGNTEDDSTGNTEDDSTGNTEDDSTGNTEDDSTGNTEDDSTGNTEDDSTGNTEDDSTGTTEDSSSGTTEDDGNGGSAISPVNMAVLIITLIPFLRI